LAALSVTAPVPAEELAENFRLCVSANTDPARRIIACGRSIAGGSLTRVDLSNVYYARARAQFDKRRNKAAIADYSEALRLVPDFSNAYHDRGVAYEAAGRFKAALLDYGRAIEANPDFASALNSKAWLLATAPDASVRDGALAVSLATRALRLVAYPEHRDTLAAAYAEAGQFDEAARAQALAVAGLRRTGRILLIPAYERRLALYRAGRPYRR
jgi:tetratricopeptide (TPR) repeat protein